MFPRNKASKHLRFLRAFIRKAVSSPSSPLVKATVDLLRELYIWSQTKQGRRVFRRLGGRQDLKLHLGCGQDIRPGWINVDLSLSGTPSRTKRDGNTIYVNYDLRRRLPLEPESCGYIHSSHFFEHLDCATGLALLEDCYRFLKPGGVFRIALPDYRRAFQAYLQGDRDFFDLLDNPNHVLSQPGVVPGEVVPMDFVNYFIYQHGEHKCAYDVDRLLQLLHRIGYKAVAESSYQEQTDPGEAVRVKYSFYAEAVK